MSRSGGAFPHGRAQLRRSLIAALSRGVLAFSQPEGSSDALNARFVPR